MLPTSKGAPLGVPTTCFPHLGRHNSPQLVANLKPVTSREFARPTCLCSTKVWRALQLDAKLPPVLAFFSEKSSGVMTED